MSSRFIERIVADAGAPTRLFAGNEWIEATGGSLVSVNPATEEEICTIGVASASDVDTVVALAEEGARIWRDTPWNERMAKINQLADLLVEVAEDMAMTDTIESGLPINGMRGDAVSAAKELRYFAGISGEAKGETYPDAKDLLATTVREPFGVVARVVPYNHPLKYAAGKSAAVLAAGNSVILKPAEQTSLSTLEFARLAAQVLPPGVVNVVTGPGDPTGMALVSHPRVPRVAFTGGVESGRRVNEAAARHFKTVSLELGGKNPLVVFPDAPVDAAAAAAVAGMNFKRSMGQSCMSQSRILVHESVHDDFVAVFSKMVAELRVGDPTDTATDLGPLAFAAHRDRVLAHIETARSEGGKITVGGGPTAGRDIGYYVDPTVVDEVAPEMRLAREEVFGPVAAIMPWHDRDQMIDTVNGLQVGLTANIWTRDQRLALDTARRIEAGLVWVNGSGRKPLGVPFGGYKDSGIGREGSIDELLGYTRKKSVVIHYGQ